MAERVLKIFYNGECLPFKDKERVVHYPVAQGHIFMGANNTTEIRFYCDEIGGGSQQWIVIGKLPNGKRGFHILGSYLEDEDGGYYSFYLSQFFTQYKGDLYLSLGGYNGNLIQGEEEQEYELSGNTLIETTGSIRITIEYSTPINGSDDEIDTWQEFLGALGEKADKHNVILPYTTYSALNGDFANYEDGQYYYCEERQSFYKNVSGVLTLIYYLNEYRDNIGVLTNKNISVGQVLDTTQIIKQVCLLTDTQGNFFVKKGVSGNNITFVQQFSLVNNSSYFTLGRAELIVNKNNGAITSSSSNSIDIYSKQQVDSNFMGVANAQTITGSKTFNVLQQYVIGFDDLGDTAPKEAIPPKGYVDRKIEEIAEKSDVVDVVGTYSQLQGYDTSKLTDNDVVKVLADSTHNNATTYYRWVITNSVGAWVYVGQDNVYSIEQVDSALALKQDKLIAGSNIQIAPNGKTISATDTKYTADSQSGIKLVGTTFSIDPTIIAKQTDIAQLVKTITYSVSGDNANFTYTLKNDNQVSVNIPLANNTNAGLMSPNDVIALATLGTKVAVLEGIVHRLLYTASANPTANQILAFVNASGYTDPTTYYGLKIVVDATQHIWVWFENLNAFQDIGLEGVLPFTNTSAGSILGSTTKGKVYAESDGTGSVLGWDDINNDLANQYNPTSGTYSVGDVVVYDSILYVCNTSISTPETWDSTKWTATNLISVLNNGLDTKVTKTSVANKLYCTDNNGDNTTITFGENPSPSTIPQRDSNGDLLVPSTPTSNNGATSKDYVDSEVAKKLDKVIYEGLAETNDSISELDYDKISVIGLTANTTFTLKPAPSVSGSGLSTIPTYKAIITNNANTSITITLPSGMVCRTNDIAIGISANTFTLGSNKSVELTIYNGGCEIINKDEGYIKDLKARYHLLEAGSVKDTKVDNNNGTTTITRKVWVVDLGSLSWSPSGSYPNVKRAIKPIDCPSNNRNIRSNNYIQNTSHLSVESLDNGEMYVGTSYINIRVDGGYPTGLLYYELSTPYTEKVIKNQPLNTLDQRGSQWVRNEYEKTLNLFSGSMQNGYYAGADGSYVSTNNAWLCNVAFVAVEPNKTYSLSQTLSGDIIVDRVLYYNSSKAFLSFYLFSNTNSHNEFTTPNNCYFVCFNYYSPSNTTISPSAITNIMLNEGDHAYPYVPYDKFNGFLKDEYNKTLNLFDPTYATSSKYINSANGNVEISSAINASNYIEIKPNTIYCTNIRNQPSWGDAGLAFYTSAKTYISGIKQATTSINNFVSPNNAKYIRISVENDQLYVAYLSEGKPIHAGSIVDLIYPVGAIYMSATNTNPSTFLGGTWSELGVHYIPKGDVPVLPRDEHTTDGYAYVMKFRANNGTVPGDHPLITKDGNLANNTASIGTDNAFMYPSNLVVRNSLTTYNTAIYLWQRTA